MELTTSAQMRAIERRAIESGAVSASGLMERAGAALAARILDRWPAERWPAERRPTERRPARGGLGPALVLCGPGNNGGDGYVVARHLRQAGWPVRVLAMAGRQSAEALAQRDLWQAFGPVEPLAALSAGREGRQEEAPALIVDALFGIGLQRDLAGESAAVLGALAAARDGDGDWARDWARVPVVAVDVPSGLCADSGRLRGPVLPADLTVTFHAAKPGHFLAQGPDVCGALAVVDIGLTTAPEPALRLIGPEQAAWLVKRGGHKYDHGHALVLAGGPGHGGAARLAARAALRIGAGLVTLGVPPAAQSENAARLEAVMLRRLADAGALSVLLEDPRITALCLGPGLGLERARDLVPVALRGGIRAVVLDADALSAFAPDPAALFARLGPESVLTPHDGEFRRLFPDLAAPLQQSPGPGPAWSRLDAVRAASARAGCVVLLKGRDTVIGAPDGRLAIHAAAYARAVPWLATAGAGDVLAGLITGLRARGVPAFEAACAGAFVHVEAALDFGPGLIAEDLPEAIPAVLRRLL